MSQLYGGIDLHGNNSVIALLQENDKVVCEQRLPNELSTMLHHLAPYRDAIVERRVQSQIKRTPLYELIQSVKGIGPILAQTILLETGGIRRFSSVGDY
ncbi:MAG: transposase, partial [bacterium]|nr:transposase [bacterium]